MSGLFKLDGKDLLRGLIVTLLAVVFSLPLDLLTDYIPFLNNQIVLVMISALFAYLAKNLATDETGKLGGRVQIK